MTTWTDYWWKPTQGTYPPSLERIWPTVSEKKSKMIFMVRDLNLTFQGRSSSKVTTQIRLCHLRRMITRAPLHTLHTWIISGELLSLPWTIYFIIFSYLQLTWELAWGRFRGAISSSSMFLLMAKPADRKPIGRPTFVFIFNSNHGSRKQHYPDISQCY